MARAALEASQLRIAVPFFRAQTDGLWSVLRFLRRPAGNSGDGCWSLAEVSVKSGWSLQVLISKHPFGTSSVPLEEMTNDTITQMSETV